MTTEQFEALLLAHEATTHAVYSLINALFFVAGVLLWFCVLRFWHSPDW